MLGWIKIHGTLVLGRALASDMKKERRTFELKLCKQTLLDLPLNPENRRSIDANHLSVHHSHNILNTEKNKGVLHTQESYWHDLGVHVGGWPTTCPNNFGEVGGRVCLFASDYYVFVQGIFPPLGLVASSEG